MKTHESFAFKPAELGYFNTGSVDPVLKNFAAGCRIMGLTRGQFSLIDLIHGVLKRTGNAHVVICTWSAGIKDAHQVDWLLSTRLIRTIRLITDHSYATRQRKYAVSITDLFGPENIRTSEVHAKFVLIHNEDHKVAIRSSMNLNANKTCETFEIDEDQEIFDFYWSFCTHLFDDMPVGFVESSWTANHSLDKFFGAKQTDIFTGWSDL